MNEYRTGDGRKLIPKHKAVEAVRTLLEYIGEDPSRPGLQETPQRVIKSYEELFSGYRKEELLPTILKTFELEEGSCDEMVLVKNIHFHSTCEHHLLPFIGKVHVAYLPKEKVIGLSKIARLVEVFSRRLQIQERLTDQISEALIQHVDPLGSACIIKSNHLCMACRGVKKQEAEMVTSSLKGRFREPAVRAELFSLVD